MTCAPKLAWDLGCTLGEGPIWSARDNAVYFVDIKGPAVHRLGLTDGARTSWAMPEMIGWLAERREGFIAGFQSGFAELSLDPLVIRPIGDPEPDLPGNRLNDGKVDPAGRLWAGTMDNAEQAASGSLYRLDPDRSWRRMDQGYRVTNGPAFSPDGRTLYHSDSALRCVYRFDLAPDGGLGEREVFIRFGEADGYPDGMTTDAEGGLWIAHWGGSRVSRFTPDGRLDRAIPVPVSQPTSCVFAGPDLDRLFVTSAAIGLTDEPLAGGLFELDTGVRGLPTGAFAG
jgi:D-xylonolactonase